MSATTSPTGTAEDAGEQPKGTNKMRTLVSKAESDQRVSSPAARRSRDCSDRG
jgi:hypothetical protein